MEKFN